MRLSIIKYLFLTIQKYTVAKGLPIALLEAMSYGLPVLVSDIPANREV
jgi:glycosyltransferase involved in cell wall biosynthesis